MGDEMWEFTPQLGSRHRHSHSQQGHLDGRWKHKTTWYPFQSSRSINNAWGPSPGLVVSLHVYYTCTYMHVGWWTFGGTMLIISHCVIFGVLSIFVLLDQACDQIGMWLARTLVCGMRPAWNVISNNVTACVQIGKDITLWHVTGLWIMLCHVTIKQLLTYLNW